ncbi:MAG: hypothetical protein WA919_29255 [Coleofasciculaceae cyanobacterium]
MGIIIFTSCLLAELQPVPLPSQTLFKSGTIQHITLVSHQPFTLPFDSVEVLGRSLGEMIERKCREVPTGVGVPAFQPGIGKSHVTQVLGSPSGTSSGYWPNTRAAFYELIPDQVSLGFLFDKNSELIRQTEASFTATVDANTVLLTLNGMLGCQLNEEIKDGLQQVWHGKSPQYNFRIQTLKGVIEKHKDNRLYIGIWEADLH